MIGKTNAVIGGSTWSWYAYIQVSTDANASITATNPAGNTYIKTANSSGAVTFTVAFPGTYTISESGATSQTVVVADYGVSYSVSIYAAPSFNGRIILDGQYQISMSALAVAAINLTPEAPTIRTNVGKVNPFNQSQYLYCVEYKQYSSNSTGILLSANKVDVTSFNYLRINNIYYANYQFIYFGVFDYLTSSTITPVVSGMASAAGLTSSLDVSSVTGLKYVGVYGANDSNHYNSISYINALWME